MPQNPWSFMPPAANPGPFQQSFFGGSPGFSGGTGQGAPRASVPNPFSAGNPFSFNRLGSGPQMLGQGTPPMAQGGSNALFNAMRNMRALTAQAAPLSVPDVLRFFSPEQTSIKSFKPPPRPPAASAPASIQQAAAGLRDDGGGAGGDAAAKFRSDFREVSGGRDFGAERTARDHDRDRDQSTGAAASQSGPR